MKKHWTQYMPEWMAGNMVASIYYVWKRHDWSLRDVIAMWRQAAKLGPGLIGVPRGRVDRFFYLVADREFNEATIWDCVYGTCQVIWSGGGGGYMGGFGLAGCRCGDLDDPRDLSKGPRL